MRRVFIATSVLALMGLAVSAGAQSLEGGCTVDATSDLDETTMTDATRGNPFEVDPEGTIAWVANSPGPIMDHTWVINVDVGGFGVPVARAEIPTPTGPRPLRENGRFRSSWRTPRRPVFPMPNSSGRFGGSIGCLEASRGRPRARVTGTSSSSAIPSPNWWARWQPE